jgi:hypothetical protein
MQDAATDVINKEDLDKAKEHLGHAKLLWFVHKIQSYGFWAIILVGIGIRLGIMYADRENVKNIDSQLLVGSFLHSSGVVYDVSPRAIQPAPLTNNATKVTTDPASTASSGLGTATKTKK